MSEQTSYWSRQARRYDRATLLLNRRFRQMAERVARDVAEAESVLEVAAGTGLITAVAAPGIARYLATDLSPGMLQLLESRFVGHAGLEVRPADASSLDFSNDSFDAVIAGNLLHLIPDVTTALGEIGRVLRPAGLLIAPTFCHGESLLARGVSRLLTLSGFPLERRLRGIELEALISSSGFQICDREWFPGLLPIRYVVAKRES